MCTGRRLSVGRRSHAATTLLSVDGTSASPRAQCPSPWSMRRVAEGRRGPGMRCELLSRAGRSTWPGTEPSRVVDPSLLTFHAQWQSCKTVSDTTYGFA